MRLFQPRCDATSLARAPATVSPARPSGGGAVAAVVLSGLLYREIAGGWVFAPAVMAGMSVGARKLAKHMQRLDSQED